MIWSCAFNIYQRIYLDDIDITFINERMVIVGTFLQQSLGTFRGSKLFWKELYDSRRSSWIAVDTAGWTTTSSYITNTQWLHTMSTAKEVSPKTTEKNPE